MKNTFPVPFLRYYKWYGLDVGSNIVYLFFYPATIVILLFPQMLMVSSTEPCTLRYSDPPLGHRPATGILVGRTVPPRPVPHTPVQGRSDDFQV